MQRMHPVAAKQRHRPVGLIGAVATLNRPLANGEDGRRRCC